MKVYRKHYSENILYGVIWLIVFIAPVMGYVFISNEENPFNWENTFILWKGLLPFLLLFVLNNYILAPYFLFRKKYILYTGALLFIILLTFSLRPTPSKPRLLSPGNDKGTKELYERERKRPTEGTELPPPPIKGEKPLRGKLPPENAPFHKQYFLFPLPVLFLHLTISILLIGFNIAIKLSFKSIENEKRMRELEHHKLQTELEYLKYQINPHFFMNTLNNIHALVDMDTIKAKKTIIELSKMMRYILYESNQKNIDLKQEIQFLNNYIELMKLRYTNKVFIEFSFPTVIPEIQIPPLLFICFVENSFKHGISYKGKSYILISIEIEENNLLFKCKNSNWEIAGEDPQTGIGLENVKKRLKLIYDTNYTLSIKSTNEYFETLLIIPL